jgi:hypothetical protein
VDFWMVALYYLQVSKLETRNRWQNPHVYNFFWHWDKNGHFYSFKFGLLWFII